jgi:uncharacterized membrane protein
MKFNFVWVMAFTYSVLFVLSVLTDQGDLVVTLYFIGFSVSWATATILDKLDKNK